MSIIRGLSLQWKSSSIGKANLKGYSVARSGRVQICPRQRNRRTPGYIAHYRERLRWALGRARINRAIMQPRFMISVKSWIRNKIHLSLLVPPNTISIISSMWLTGDRFSSIKSSTSRPFPTLSPRGKRVIYCQNMTVFWVDRK